MITLAAVAATALTLVCEAAYLPERRTWRRTVEMRLVDNRVRELRIDGVPVHDFLLDGSRILTALDNERITIDAAAQTWRSDFRGLATGQGRCERE